MKGSRWWRALVLCALSVLLASACGGGGGAKSSSKTASSTPKKGSGKVYAGADPGSQSAGDPSQAGYTPTGTIVADDGFRPADNGFPFSNYGAALPDGSGAASNLDAAAMQKLYGTAVCADPACNLTPEALAYVQQLNSAMGGGHCYGFSVLAQMIWSGQAKASDYGGSAVNALTIDGNSPLMSDIALAWSFQTLPAVQSAQVTGDPNAILNQLKTLLVPNPKETYTLDIFNGQDGHAITPYAIEDNGGGLFHVLVYDNNWPGVTRAVTFDTNADTWQYVAALNPNDPSQLYSGTAANPQINLQPTTPGTGTQPWPYGGSNTAVPQRSGPATATLLAYTASSSQPMQEVYLTGSDTHHGHLLITNAAGEQIGYSNGKMVNTIPGARALMNVSSRPWLESQEPEYLVPYGPDYKITVEGAGLSSVDNGENIGVIAPGHEVKVGHVDLHPGETDSLNVSGDGSKVDYTASDKQAVTINDGVTNGDKSFDYTVSGADLPAGANVDFGVPAGTDKLDFSDSASDPGVTIAMQEDTPQGQSDFTHDNVAITGGAQDSLDPTNWSNGQDIPLQVTDNGQTSTDNLSDQPGEAAPPDDTDQSQAAANSSTGDNQPQATTADQGNTQDTTADTTQDTTGGGTQGTTAETTPETAPPETAAPDTAAPDTAAPETTPAAPPDQSSGQPADQSSGSGGGSPPDSTP